MTTPVNLLNLVMEELLNKKNVTAVEDIFHPEFKNHDPAPGYASDRQGLKEFFVDLFNAFDPFGVESSHFIMEGEYGVVRFIMMGVHVGAFMGAEPTHKKLHLPVISIVRMEDDKIIERWSEQDNLDAMQQLWD